MAKIDHITDEDRERFLSRVDSTSDPDDCWPWTGCTGRTGYGKISIQDQRLTTHRLAFFIKTGQWPKLYVLHSCDNPPCCNPAHLREGTAQDNQDDRSKRGRAKGPQGEDNWSAKLTAAQVREIRHVWKPRVPGLTLQLSSKYGVGHGTITEIGKGTRWRHIV